MPRRFFSPRTARSAALGHYIIGGNDTILSIEPAIICSLILGAALVASTAAYSTTNVWEAGTLGVFIAIQFILFLAQLPEVSVLVFGVAYLIVFTNRWEVAFISSTVSAASIIAFLLWPRKST